MLHDCRVRIVILSLIVLYATAATTAAQVPDVGGRPKIESQPENTPALSVITEDGKTHRISATDFAKLPRQSVKTKSNQTDVEFEGVSLVDLLKSLGVTFGHDLRGPRASNVVLCAAKDGYRVAFSQLEIDPDTTDKVVIVADRRDGKALVEPEGPLRLIVPDEKRPVRWIRMLQTIRIANLKDLPMDYSPKSISELQPSK